MEPKIKVDQSHCNFRLSHWLEAEGWTVLFRDPGRVSRGLSGSQELLLGVFEQNGWPIPDIVATGESSLLFFEIDQRIQAALNSINRYRDAEIHILDAVKVTGAITLNVNNLLIGFCKIGDLKKADAILSSNDIDALAWFSDPMTPTVHWR